MKCIVLKETYDDGHPPIFVAVCLRTFVAGQGDTIYRAKQCLAHCLRVQDITGGRKIKPAPRALLEYARKHPECVYFVTKRQLRAQFKLIRAANEEAQP